jgi:hypothetical protein
MNEAANTEGVISPNALQIHDGEPRVADVTLAAALGFKRPRAIRDLITRNNAELEAYGSIAVLRGAYRNHATKTHLLNEHQAILIAILSQAPKASDVRRALIEVFVAYRRSQVPRDDAHEAPRRAADPSPEKNHGRIRFWKFRFAEAAAELDVLGVDVEAIDLKVVTAFGRVIVGDGRMIAKRN